MVDSRPPLAADALIGHASFVRRLARALLGDPHLAEDVAQDAMLAAIRRPPGRPDRLRGWLAAVTRNLAGRVRRTRGRRERREQGAAKEERVPAAVEVAAHLEAEERLMAAVRALPEDQQTVVVLRYLEEMGPTAIAKRLSVPVRTVESRLRRALERLRGSLDQSTGSRRAWSLAFLSLLDLWPAAKTAAGLAGPTAAILGGVLVSAKLKMLVGAIILAAVSIAVWQVTTPESDAPSRPPETADREKAPEDETPPVEPVEESESTVADAGADTPSAGSAWEYGACHGRITYDDGDPVANEPVWAYNDFVPMVKTDADGNYRFERLKIEAAPRTLMLGPPSAANTLGTVALEPGKDISTNFVIPRGVELTIRIRSRDGGKPATTKVSLFPRDRSRGTRPAYARADGARPLTIRRLTRDKYHIRAHADGYREFRGYLDLTGASKTATHEIELTPAERMVLTVKGWPRGASGKVAIMMSTRGGDPYQDLFHERGQLSREGVYSWDAPAPGTYRVSAFVGGIRIPQFETVVNAAGPTNIEVELPPGAEVAGHVLDDDGSPIPDATVRLTGSHPNNWSPSTKTGKDGAFSFPVVPPGTYGVTIELHEQTFSSVADDLTIDDAGRQGVELRLPAGGRIDGRLVGFDNSFPASALRSVDLSLRSADGWKSWGSVTPAYHGGFHAIRLPAGRWRLSVEGSPIDNSGGGVAVELDLAPGGHVTGVEILKRVSPTIEIRLLTPSGDPFTSRVSAHASTLPEGETRILMLKPDKKGTCRIEALAPGTWRLSFLGGPKMMVVHEIQVMRVGNVAIELRLW